MGVKPLVAVAGIAAVVLAAAPFARAAAPAADRFRAANERARAADYPKAIAAYAELARSGAESASLYWNWAQAAAASGAQGEALWALLRARELEPGDRAVSREVERLREALNLDRAEIAPEPLAAAARFSRRFRLDLAAIVLLVLSLACHLLVRLGLPIGGPWRALAVTLLATGALAAVPSLAASFARPTAAVVRRGAPLLDAASPSAGAISTLREGEVVPVLEGAAAWLRVEDNAGARGWARTADVRLLDRPPSE
jgi:hypothetical protein